jgi:hypothetical protein
MITARIKKTKLDAVGSVLKIISPTDNAKTRLAISLAGFFILD